MGHFQIKARLLSSFKVNRNKYLFYLILLVLMIVLCNLATKDVFTTAALALIFFFCLFLDFTTDLIYAYMPPTDSDRKITIKKVLHFIISFFITIFIISIILRVIYFIFG